MSSKYVLLASNAVRSSVTKCKILNPKSDRSSVQFALPNFSGDDVIVDVIDWSWKWEKVAHQNRPNQTS